MSEARLIRIFLSIFTLWSLTSWIAISICLSLVARWLDFSRQDMQLPSVCNSYVDFIVNPNVMILIGVVVAVASLFFVAKFSVKVSALVIATLSLAQISAVLWSLVIFSTAIQVLKTT